MTSRVVLLLGVVLQLAVLVGMIVFKAAPLVTGETVWLRVVPVDPRDLFRGDYVVLDYDFSRVPPDGIPELGKLSDDQKDQWQGATVYVSLVPEDDGKHWRMSKLGTQPPAEGLYLRGTIDDSRRIRCGIEAFYVQEGAGREYEEAARNRRLSAEVAIAADGRATLRALHVDTENTPGTDAAAKPAYDSVNHFRWPSDTVYRVQHLPHAKIAIDGRLNEPEWSRANVERHFAFPWQKADAPLTEFMALCDDRYLYFAFHVDDADIVAFDKLRDEQDAAFEDRVELYFSLDEQMRNYFNLEIDSRGRVYDYRGAYYRKLDPKWNCKGVEAAGTTSDKGYTVEGRIPLATLVELGFPRLKPGTRIPCGIYRAEFHPDRSGKPVVQKATIHDQGRKPPEGLPPIEGWISWIDPKTPEPDFHVPSSLGWLEVVE